MPFVGLWLHTPLGVLESRITARSADASDATVAVLRRFAATDPGACGWVEVDARDAGSAIGVARRALVGISAEPQGSNRG